MSDQSAKEIPQDVPTARFHDERIQMGYWLSTLEDLDGVRVPETVRLSLHEAEDGTPDWNTGDAIELVEQLGGEAFVRSDYKSAQMHLEEGGHIRSPDHDEVDATLMELISQHMMMQMPLVGKLYLREWLPLEWNAYARETLHPEVRAFIRDGEVVCHHPRLEWARGEWEGHEDNAKAIIERDWNDEIRPMAERVAAEFDGDGWFSVDFVCTVNYRWFCTDMAVDALYERDGEWQNISAHPGDCEHDLENEVDTS